MDTDLAEKREAMPMMNTLTENVRLIWACRYKTNTGLPNRDMLVFVNGHNVCWDSTTGEVCKV